MPEEPTERNQEVETQTNEDVTEEESSSPLLQDFDVESLTEEEKRNLVLQFEDSVTQKEQRSIADELDIRREDTRSTLAIILISILGITYAVAIITMGCVIFIPVGQGEERTDRYTYSKDILSLLITTQTGLIGAVLGFYFGSSRNRG